MDLHILHVHVCTCTCLNCCGGEGMVLWCSYVHVCLLFVFLFLMCTVLWCSSSDYSCVFSTLFSLCVSRLYQWSVGDGTETETRQTPAAETGAEGSLPHAETPNAQPPPEGQQLLWKLQLVATNLSLFFWDLEGQYCVTRVYMYLRPSITYDRAATTVPIS